jgi:hypothetical protein
VADLSESGTILDSSGNSTNGNGWHPPNSAAQQFTPRMQPYTPPQPAAVAAADIQSRGEGAHTGEVTTDGTHIDFMGRPFRISGRVGLMPLLRFAHSARNTEDSTDPAALLALYDLIADCVDQDRPQRIKVDPATGREEIDPVTGLPVTEDAGPSQWDLFQDYATSEKADDEDLMDFVGKVIEVLSARPKRRRGSSPDGRTPTSGSSKAASPSPVSAPTAARLPDGMEGLVPVTQLVPRS